MEKWNAREIYTVFSFCKFQKVVLKNISMYTIFKFYYFEKNLFLNIESKKKKNFFQLQLCKTLIYKKNQRIFFSNIHRVSEFQKIQTDLHSNAHSL